MTDKIDAVEAVVKAICSADDSTCHHERTDDYPCSACKADATVLVPILRAKFAEEGATAIEAEFATCPEPECDECTGGNTAAELRTTALACKRVHTNMFVDPATILALLDEVDALWDQIHRNEDQATSTEAERDAALAEIERLRSFLRCGAVHPVFGSVVPCVLDKGHESSHVSPTARDGSTLHWPSVVHATLVQRDAARAEVVLLRDEIEGVDVVLGAMEEDHQDDLDALRARLSAVEGPEKLTKAVCTDPDCTIRQKPGRPMHGPHDFRAALNEGEPASNMVEIGGQTMTEAQYETYGYRDNLGGGL